MEQAREKHKEEGLLVLWIGHQDRVEKLDGFAAKNGITDYLYDSDDSMSRKFGMTYGGGVVFIDRDAVVKSRIPKGLSPAKLEEALKKIL